MKKILIIDTKAGNLFSLRAAIERLGFKAKILQKPNEDFFDAIVIPGQGRFGSVMRNIHEKQWPDYLANAYQQSKPILGICVGMQIFFEGSDEDPEIKGLGWFKGRAQALDFPKKPMVGWAKLSSKVWPDSSFYFVNSYAVKHSELSIAETIYGENFCAAIKSDGFIGVQFHPEKSSEVGSQLIQQALSGTVGETV